MKRRRRKGGGQQEAGEGEGRKQGRSARIHRSHQEDSFPALYPYGKSLGVLDISVVHEGEGGELSLVLRFLDALLDQLMLPDPSLRAIRREYRREGRRRRRSKEKAGGKREPEPKPRAKGKGRTRPAMS